MPSNTKSPTRSLGRRLFVAALFVATLLVNVAIEPAHAQTTPSIAAAPAAKDNNAGKDEGWQQVTTQMIVPGESFQATTLVAVAYGFIWLMVAGFVLSIWRRSDRLDKEIEALRSQIARRPGAAK